MIRITASVMALIAGQTLLGQGTEIQHKAIQVGDYAFGGLVLFVDSTGQHGLVCAITDQISGIFWDDKLNESGIYPVQSSVLPSGSSENLAEKVCSDYSVKEGEIMYDDWTLPSKEEVRYMYENKLVIDKCAVTHGGASFRNNDELSPTEYCNNPAWDQVFNYGYRDYEYKKSKFNVRAIRRF